MMPKTVFSICLILAVSVVSQIAGQSTRVDLKLSARELPDMDIFEGPPDPYCVVYYAASQSDQYQKIGETRYYDDVWGAEWPESFTFNYIPGAGQRIKIDVMDYDWDEDDYIGLVEFNLSDLMNTFGYVIDRPVIGTKNKGFLTVKGFVNAAKEGEAEVKIQEAKVVPTNVLVHQTTRANVPEVAAVAVPAAAAPTV
jgi:hypothetical protein